MSDLQQLNQMFKNPEATYRPQPFWFLNHEFKQEELSWQLQEMVEKGVGGVVLHSRHGKTTDYLSESFFEMMKYCMEECRKYGIHVWLYDEDNWPSGTFGGKLTQQFPQYRMRYLRIDEKRYHTNNSKKCLLDFELEANNSLISILAYRIKQQDGDSIILLADPYDLTNQRGTEWLPTEVGDYVVLAFWECEVAEKVTFANGYYLDTMNPEAVEKFIEMGYAPFDRLADDFGTLIQGVFTDEPGLMIHDGFFGVEAIRTCVEKLQYNLPGMIFGWTRNFQERFEQRFGYSIHCHLGSLLYRVEQLSHKIREDYYTALTEWYVDAYHRALRSWCQTRELKYIGHTLEEPIWGQARSQGNQTRVLQQFHYPGVDYLTAGIGTKENPFRILSVKCSSSVAHLEGKQRIVCEAFGASDHCYSMRQRRLDGNFMAFLGVNLFIPHAFYYSFEGYRKTDFPQTEFYHAPHWGHYKAFADYIGRLSLMGSLGYHDSHILLLNPIHTVYQEMFEHGKSEMKPASDLLYAMLSDRLIRNQLDFDYVDECQISDSMIEAGAMKFVNSQEWFNAIILPGMKVMSLETAEKLVEFTHSGGALIAIGEVPLHSFSQENDPELSHRLKLLFPQAESKKWIAQGKGKTLFLSALDVTADDGLYLSEQLKELPEIDYVSERWVIPNAFKEKVIISSRIMEGKRFFWVMNWSEDLVQISCLVQSGEMAEEWKLESGEIAPLNDQALKSFILYPGELRIINARPYDSLSIFSPDYQNEQSVELSPLWEFSIEDPNVKILDRWEVTLNDRESRMNAIMPGQTNSYRTRVMIDESFAGKDLRLITDDIDQYIPSHIGFLSRRKNVEIYVNGHQLPALEPSQWQDHFYKSVDITPFVNAGENLIEIVTLSLLEPMIRFAFPAFLVGDFALGETGKITKPITQLSGYWENAGYPSFAGKAVYSQKILLDQTWFDDSQQQIELVVTDVRETASIWINDRFVGTCLWPPYHWDITNFVQKGKNQIRIQVANTLENLYGKRSLPSGIAGKATLTRKFD